MISRMFVMLRSALQRVLHAPCQVLRAAGDLLGPAVHLQLGVAGQLADGFLHRAGQLLAGALGGVAGAEQRRGFGYRI